MADSILVKAILDTDNRQVGSGGQRTPRLLRRARRDETGQTLTVELILLFPLMLALVFGVLEFGWWVNAHMVTANAASQAARTVALEGKISAGTVPEQIKAVATGGDLNPNKIAWNATVKAGGVTLVTAKGSLSSPYPYISCIEEGPGGFTEMTDTVKVTYKYQMLFPFLRTPMFLGIGNALPGTITAKATVPVEQEWVGPTCGPVG